jgi:hypothetical protein
MLKHNTEFEASIAEQLSERMELGEDKDMDEDSASQTSTDDSSTSTDGGPARKSRSVILQRQAMKQAATKERAERRRLKM